MRRTTICFLFCAAVMAASTLAHAQIIDFASLPLETQVTNQYAQFTVSLVGGPNSIGPSETENGTGLCNSTFDCSYPTNNILEFDFTSPTNVVGMVYNNEDGNMGANGDVTGTTHTAYNSSDAVVATGNLSGVQGAPVNIYGTGIVELQINNNCGSSFCNNNGGLTSYGDWVFNVTEINPTAAITPEPGTYGLTVIGLGLLALMPKRLLSPLA